MRRAQHFLYAAGRLLFACQHELGYALARWAVHPVQGRAAASPGGAHAGGALAADLDANAGMGEVRAAAGEAKTAAGVAGAAAASSLSEDAALGAGSQSSEGNHEGAAAGVAGTGAAAAAAVAVSSY